MTDVINLALRLRRNVEWQIVPDNVTQDDLVDLIVEAIRYLYVMTGRYFEFSEDMFIKSEDGQCMSFAQALQIDEELYVLVTAELAFYEKVQSSVSELTSYTTDAMAVAHGDKPFANLQQKIDGLTDEQTKLWYKMHRYHLL